MTLLLIFKKIRFLFPVVWNEKKLRIIKWKFKRNNSYIFHLNFNLMINSSRLWIYVKWFTEYKGRKHRRQNCLSLVKWARTVLELCGISIVHVAELLTFTLYYLVAIIPKLCIWSFVIHLDICVYIYVTGTIFIIPLAPTLRFMLHVKFEKIINHFFVLKNL